MVPDFSHSAVGAQNPHHPVVEEQNPNWEYSDKKVALLLKSILGLILEHKYWSCNRRKVEDVTPFSLHHLNRYPSPFLRRPASSSVYLLLPSKPPPIARILVCPD
ncbi:hypothetical protein QL285_004401 [Trifolium repens]|nr:hypothetical protein QL285_004401 [Trifolium repens]